MLEKSIRHFAWWKFLFWNHSTGFMKRTVCFMLVRTEGGRMLLCQQLLHKNWWILKHLHTKQFSSQPRITTEMHRLHGLQAPWSWRCRTPLSTPLRHSEQVYELSRWHSRLANFGDGNFSFSSLTTTHYNPYSISRTYAQTVQTKKHDECLSPLWFYLTAYFPTVIIIRSAKAWDINYWTIFVPHSRTIKSNTEN